MKALTPFSILLLLFGNVAAVSAADRRPNVIVVMTDDQGFAELGVTGNPVVRTPHIDRFASQSAVLTQFNVMPVCSPTRAGLITGRDYYRTGVTDTWMGCSMIDPDETTLAELFSNSGYRTGIFGKWHLGDNYPRRAMDLGFQESLVLNGGGLAQPSDPPDSADERGAYFNATMLHNGRWMKTDGYVSDVLTNATLQFIEQNKDQPFFAYLPFNSPHSPHQVPDKYREHYQPKMFDASNFPNQANPSTKNAKPNDLTRVYGMIENIDDNVGRLLAKLDELKLTENTIVVFLSDNGCQQHGGYNGGLRGWKGSPYEGGIHQFCFLRWPRQLQAGRKVDRIAANTDLAPTLLDFCGIAKPDEVKFDGRSLAPLLRGEEIPWPDRPLFFQWHRGSKPERYRSCAVRVQDWKLVQPLGAGEAWDGKTDFQLFDMSHDPFEMHNVAAENPARVATLKAAYNAWFDDINSTRDFSHPQRIFIGARQENPVLLTRQDWSGPKATWDQGGIGSWELNVVNAASYNIKLRFNPSATEREAKCTLAGITQQQVVRPGSVECVFENLQLPNGPCKLEAVLQEGQNISGVKYAEINRLEKQH